MSENDKTPTGLELLQSPFPEDCISLLPKPTKAQTDEVKRDYKKGIRCDKCGGWHHPKVVHLSYVGHAALTKRLLDVDPKWNWSPVSDDANGFPLVDNDGGMWIRLTVLGVTRLGYGDSSGKTGTNATKERIGDALRNAAMRFGAALDLWHKSDTTLNTLSIKESGQEEPKQPTSTITKESDSMTQDKMDEIFGKICLEFSKCSTVECLNNIANKYKGNVALFDDNYTNEAKTAYTENVARINKLNS